MQPAAMHQVDVRYSQALVRAAVRAYWPTLRERFGWPRSGSVILGLVPRIHLSASSGAR
jgi:hypothetical protein